MSGLNSGLFAAYQTIRQDTCRLLSALTSVAILASTLVTFATSGEPKAPRFPLSRGVLSGLPDIVAPRLECVPTLVLIGADDDLSSPSACRQMIDNARGRSALARIIVYPNAHHGFDQANVALHPVAEGHGHIGTDPGARADSQKRVAVWLAR